MTGLQKKILMISPAKIISEKSIADHSLETGRLKGLIESVSLIGILEPVVVRKKERHYELIRGSRRLHAARLLGLKKIPCIVYDIDDNSAVIFSLIRDIQLERTSYLEVAKRLDNILKSCPISKRELSLRLGITLDSLIYRLEPLRFSAPIREKLDFYGTDEDTARLLLKLPPEKREWALEKIGSEQLGFKESEKLINRSLTQKEDVKKENTAFEKTVIKDVKIFANSLVKLVDVMQKSGFNTHFKRTETEKYTEYKIRIIKNVEDIPSPQLRII